MSHFDEEPLRELAAQLTADGIDIVRIGYSDLIGTERGRDVLVDHFVRTVGDGVAFCRSVYGTSPMGDVVDVAGGLSAGLPDIVAFPDVATARKVPWEPGVAHVIADVYNPDGSPSEESPRMVLKRVVEQFAELGMTPIVGPELEFYVVEKDDDCAQRLPPVRRGHRQRLRRPASRATRRTLLLASLRELAAYDIDVVAANHEFSSGQFEINLWHSEALDAADRAFRFKTALKELARRRGKMATFMAKPFNDEGGSGFHIHFSTVDDQGRPLFDDPAGEDGLSKIARSAIAGVLAHAPALAAISNPTINSYKRFGPDTLAPWLVDWGLDNRSAMIRIPPERGRASRMELRLGDASANPYLAIAGLLGAAYLGIRDGLEPPAKLEGYGYDTSKADKLPGDLGTALDALEEDKDLADDPRSGLRLELRHLQAQRAASGSASTSRTGSSGSTPTTCEVWARRGEAMTTQTHRPRVRGGPDRRRGSRVGDRRADADACCGRRLGAAAVDAGCPHGPGPRRRTSCASTPCAGVRPTAVSGGLASCARPTAGAGPRPCTPTARRAGPSGSAGRATTSRWSARRATSSSPAASASRRCCR